MNKLSLSTPSFRNISVDDSETLVREVNSESSRRMIVLVPPGTECASLTRRICKIAHETNSDVLLLGLSKDTSQEFALQRELITASAMIHDAKVFAEMKIEIGTDWLTVVRRHYRIGDTIVCIMDPTIGIRRKPLSQILESTFQAPIYVLTDAKPPKVSSPVLSQVIAWSGVIGIIVVFFILQAQIIGLPDNWSKTVLSVLMLVPELLSILFWNSLF